MADPLDPSESSILDIMAGSGPTAREVAGALTARLRKRQALAEAMATVPALGGSAKVMAENVGGRQHALESASQVQALHGPAIRAGQLAEDPNSPTSQIASQVADQLGLSVPQGTPASAYQGLLPEAIKAAGIGKFDIVKDYMGNPVAKVNRHTGEVSRLGLGGGGAPGAGGGMAGDKIDMFARQWLKTGQPPQLPGFRGKYGIPMFNKISDRMVQIMKENGVPAPEIDLAGARATYGADTKSLANVQKSADALDAFENTAGKNLDLFLDSAKKIMDSGSPWLNKPLRAVSRGGLGSAELAAFDTARQVATTEAARVLGNPNLGGQLTDSARHEIAQIAGLGPDATFPQVVSAVKTLRQDFQNRRAAYADTLKGIRGRITAKPGETAVPEAAPAPAGGGLPKVGTPEEARALPKGTHFLDPNGVERVR